MPSAPDVIRACDVLLAELRRLQVTMPRELTAQQRIDADRGVTAVRDAIVQLACAVGFVPTRRAP